VRALNRTAFCTTANCAVPPLYHQSMKTEMVASHPNNLGNNPGKNPGMQRRVWARRGIDGMAMRESDR
jgi:hypothetical protein